LRAHAWPGNVRELRNVIERAVVLGRSSPLAADELGCLLSSAAAPACGTTLDAVVERAEREAVMAALSQSRGNLAGAARTLGVERASLYRILKRLGMERAQDGGEVRS
jgi:two-component system NtrC family response regulator